MRVDNVSRMRFGKRERLGFKSSHSYQRNALNPGQYRDSVRIHSRKHYNQGLFILDVEHVPTGCSSWPAFWFCGPDWPVGGEVRYLTGLHRWIILTSLGSQIDVMESVHRGTKNQMTLHTDNGKRSSRQ